MRTNKEVLLNIIKETDHGLGSSLESSQDAYKGNKDAAMLHCRLKKSLMDMKSANWEVCRARYLAAYAKSIPTLPSRELWPKVEMGFTVDPPRTIRPRGRPKKKRIKGKGEEKKLKRVHICQRCGKAGHHKNTCKQPLNQEPGQSSQGTETSARGRCRRTTRGRGASRGRGATRRDGGEEEISQHVIGNTQSSQGQSVTTASSSRGKRTQTGLLGRNTRRQRTHLEPATSSQELELVPAPYVPPAMVGPGSKLQPNRGRGRAARSGT